MITIYIKEWKKEEIFTKYNLPNWIKNITYNIIKKINYIRKKEIGENKTLNVYSPTFTLSVVEVQLSK